MKHLLLASAATLFAVSAAPAFAQDAAEDEVAEGDIIVTATRSETLLSKTPLAVTAITGDDLRDQGITGPTGLGESVPNLSIDRANGLQITIRGVTSTDGTEKGNPSAAFLADGIYLARPQQADIAFFDVARVEVLRGPQGTLYGRNTTAGVVNVISNRPNPDAFGAGMNIGYGNYDALNVDGFVNLPMGEMAAFRIAAAYDRRDNFIHPLAGDPASLDPFRENFAVRAQALFKLGDNGDILLRGNYGKLQGTRVTGVPTSNFYLQTGNGTATTLDPNNNAIWAPISRDNDVLLTRNLRTIPINPAWGGGNGENTAYGLDNSTWSIDGEINYDFGGITATYLGSYREYKANENSNLDIRGLLPTSLPGFLAALMGNFNGDCAHPTEQCSYPGMFNGDYEAQSHELRFALNNDGPLDLQAGGYYFREHSVIAFWIPDFPEFIIGPNKFYGFPQETTSSTIGAFMQGTYSITDTFRLTAGVRYTHDDLFRYGHTVAANSITAPIVLGGSTYANDAQVVTNKVTWRAGFDLDVGRGLVYGSVATGYKIGGFGDGCSTGLAGGSLRTSQGERCDAVTLRTATLPVGAAPCDEALTATLCYNDPQAIYYQPENVTAYEIGYRGPIMDGLRIDLTGFYLDYTNMQLSSLLNINGAPTLVTTNAGRARVYGIEFESTINPTDNLQFKFGMNITDAKYKHFCPGGTGTSNPLDACTAGTPNYAGRSLDRTPVHTAFASFNWTIPMGESEFVIGAGTKMTGKYSITQFGSSPVQYFTPAHTNTQASITFNGPERRWYLQGYVQNIENFIEIRGATADTVTPGDPRTFGVRAGFNF
jgi:iron complex outermembrane receptor protein